MTQDPSRRNSDDPDSSPSTTFEAARPTRNRKAYSCTECRRRKKHCDRRVPGCNQCVIRGTVDICRWGDERDNELRTLQSRSACAAISAEAERNSSPELRRMSDRMSCYESNVTRQRSRSRSPERRSSWSRRHEVDGSRERPHRDEVHGVASSSDLQIPTHFGIGRTDFGNGIIGRATAMSRTQEHHRKFGGEAKGNYAPATYFQSHRSVMQAEIIAAEVDMGLRDPGESPADESAETPMTSVSSKVSRDAASSHPPKSIESMESVYAALHRENAVPGTLEDSYLRDCYKLKDKIHTPQQERQDEREGDEKEILLTFRQARELFALYKSMSNRIVVYDEQLVEDVLGKAMSENDSSGNTIELLEGTPDTYALILIVCASALFNMPPTYAITMGLIGRCEELTTFLAKVTEASSKALDSLPGPTFTGVQAHNLFQHNLTASLSAQKHVILKDRIVREARFLGLDRLGSPEEDEALWRKRDEEQARRACGYDTVQGQGSNHGHRAATEVFWAADTFRRRDRRARNLGRCHWLFLRAKDWVGSRISGCYMIAEHSYTTSLPRPYPDFENEIVTEHDALVFKYLEVGLQSSRKTTDMVAEAFAIGERVDYEKILELDAELMEALESRPASLRPEDGLDPLASTGESLFVSSTLWHRLFVLHRPYLMLSQTDPEKYGLSALRSWDYALLTIKAVREASRTMLKYWPPLYFRVLQAALVLISHLFIWPHRMTLQQTITIHDELNWVVMILRSLGSMSDGTSIFAGTSDRLEALLAGASKIKRSQGSGDPSQGIGGMAAPWIRTGKSDGHEAVDLSYSAMKHAAEVASQARLRKHASTSESGAKRVELTRDEQGDPTWSSLDFATNGNSENATAPSASAMPNASFPAPNPALGVLDMQLFRLMGEGNINWQDLVSPPDAGGAAALDPLYDQNSQQGMGAEIDYVAAANAFGAPAPHTLEMNNNMSRSQTVAAPTASGNAAESGDLWSEIFAYVNAATASLPQTK